MRPLPGSVLFQSRICDRTPVDKYHCNRQSHVVREEDAASCEEGEAEEHLQEGEQDYSQMDVKCTLLMLTTKLATKHTNAIVDVRPRYRESTMHEYVHTYIHIYTHLHTVSAHVQRVHTYMHARIFVRTHIMYDQHVRTYVFICVCMSVYNIVQMFVHVYVYGMFCLVCMF